MSPMHNSPNKIVGNSSENVAPNSMEGEGTTKNSGTTPGAATAAPHQRLSTMREEALQNSISLLRSPPRSPRSFPRAMGSREVDHAGGWGPGGGVFASPDRGRRPTETLERDPLDRGLSSRRSSSSRKRTKTPKKMSLKTLLFPGLIVPEKVLSKKVYELARYGHTSEPQVGRLEIVRKTEGYRTIASST